MTTILVTGATDGLGLAVARELASRGNDVLAHGRDAGRLAAAAREIGAAGTFLADFSSLAQVRALELPELDVLVNNAGLISPERVVTEDGNELTFQVNHLAHFLLTLRVMPRRVVHVASGAQRAPDFGDLTLERGYEPWRAYGQSKLAQIMFSNELAARHPELESVALHPATFMDTKMVRETIGTPHSTVAEGVEATARLVTEPDVSGKYFNGLREATPDRLAADPDARRALWEISERLTA
jgi:NAD(P)-dependent dehydrogenase (short-subunit alcohol dehydrogenase family)